MSQEKGVRAKKIGSRNKILWCKAWLRTVVTIAVACAVLRLDAAVFSPNLLEAHGLQLTLLKDVHNWRNNYHGIRADVSELWSQDRKQNMTEQRCQRISSYEQVDASLKKGSTPGRRHEFCSLAARDNWVCMGEHYESVLRNTLPYNRSLSLDAFPKGTRIFAEGNSFFAQKVSLVICNSQAKFWLLDGTNSNSMLAYNSDRDVGLLLLDNDQPWNNNFTRTVAMLKTAWKPTLIVLGDLNKAKLLKQSTARIQEYRDAFPHRRVPVVPCGGRGLPNDCGATLCGDGRIFGICTNSGKKKTREMLQIPQNNIGKCCVPSTNTHACVPGEFRLLLRSPDIPCRIHE